MRHSFSDSCSCSAASATASSGCPSSTGTAMPLAKRRVCFLAWLAGFCGHEREEGQRLGRAARSGGGGGWRQRGGRLPWTPNCEVPAHVRRSWARGGANKAESRQVVRLPHRRVHAVARDQRQLGGAGHGCSSRATGPHLRAPTKAGCRQRAFAVGRPDNPGRNLRALK